ncbi:hypothetical protein [Pedobacter mucosus]|uniref:hypothetical protein n=1 Tax=Pedobacter mucosus TaxID=2895286 RepID=UPI001EE4ABB5|nr:hypothetical protein [Pedobacter mucosus]UKT64863.1 hypothetical protein LOK61_03610 [Pedobacter mucosus]
MKDTSEEVKKLQLQIWLAKSPEIRLRQMLIDNESLYNFWSNIRQIAKSNSGKNK